MIIEKGGVAHLAGVVDDQLFMQCRADAHDDAAFDLRGAIQRINRLADVMGRRHAQDADAAALFVHLDLSGLGCVHVKRRSVVAVAGFQVQVLANFIGVRTIAAYLAVDAELAPHHFADGQRLPGLVLQKDFAVGVAEILHLGLQHRAGRFHDLLARVDRGAAHRIAHVIGAAARGGRGVEWNHVGVQRVHANLFHRHF